MRRDLATLAQGREFDLLVLGGGINGAAVARDARLRGLTVALVERGDWGSGTSSRSSRLVHGGLRYLEHLALGLVRESLHERAVLLRIAPHLVEPLRFLAPGWGDEPRGLGAIGFGVALYELLAGSARIDRRERLSPAQVHEREPLLRRHRLEGAVCYSDARCDDARLVLATVRSAWAAGAACGSYLEAEMLLREGGRVCGARLLDRLDGRRFEIRARAVVNATGPWADRTAALGGEETTRLRLTRGAHIVVPRLARDALLLPTRDRRVLFVLPDGECSIVGTTDTDHHGPLDDVAATREDVSFLLEEAGRALPEARLAPGHVLASWAALRPLAAAGGLPGALSREDRIEVGPGGMLTIVGGKLTTHRALAERAVDRLARQLGRDLGGSRTAAEPLDGGAVGDLDAFAGREAAELELSHRLPRRHGERLARRYGTRVGELARLLAEAPALVGRLCRHHSHLAVEAAYAAEAEMAVSLGDFLFRRTRIGFGRCRGLDCAEAAAVAMGDALGWSRARREDEVESFRAESARLAQPR